jgi:hypothetical protein
VPGCAEAQPGIGLSPVQFGMDSNDGGVFTVLRTDEGCQPAI